MQRWLFMGNPGSGKSTLLNCLLQRAAFDAGLSFGGGRTQTAQSERWTDNIFLVDTPGVADVEVRQEACAAITAALKHDGVYKLFFVVTMRNGRAPPEDVATYNEVLRSIAVRDIKFSLIINSVQKQQYALVTGNPENRDRAIAGLGGGDFFSDSILFIPAMPELDEEDNVVVALPDFVHQFLVDAPACEIPPSAVGKINTDTDAFRAKSAELASNMRALQHQKAALQSQLASLEQSNRSDPRAAMVNPSGTPQQGVRRSSGGAARLASLHQPDLRDSRAVPQPMHGCAAQPRCKCGHTWTSDEMTKGLFCPECGVQRGVPPTALAGAGVDRAGVGTARYPVFNHPPQPIADARTTQQK